ncbi:uncharacterized protein ANIA_05756 [Aspergillus nidulans FGSC A4]|uniref:Uncharacterized protein n=1 Tax=Emericella nidulans (strain FGSC A4 / ATCC 38163 / CBS 112.46 / NRRL 194 / M139) TaxID=227321 RepID=C8VFI3_EMENI|nr:hypothetical protein [Aspergillus nidulans FGSC A4]CBF81268.1 TPA: conserved hypothetical protein [Aspergillus nidulans FGSC A4]
MISVLLTAHTIALSYIVITSIQSPSDGGEYAISAQTDNAYVPAETSVAQQTAGRLSARRDLSDTAEDSIKTSPITAQNIVSEYRQEPNKLKTSFLDLQDCASQSEKMRRSSLIWIPKFGLIHLLTRTIIEFLKRCTWAN